MKTIAIASFVALALATGGAAAQTGAAGKASKAETGQAVGVVKKTDPDRLAATIEHGPVKALNWPGMTMTFKVKDKATLAKLVPDKKVEFTLVKQGNDYVITSVK